MPEIDEDLVPTDGLTSARIKFVGFDIIDDHVQVKFAVTNAEGDYATVFPVLVSAPPGDSTADWFISQGHRQLRDILRQWLYEIDAMTKAYEKFLLSPAVNDQADAFVGDDVGCATRRLPHKEDDAVAGSQPPGEAHHIPY